MVEVVVEVVEVKFEMAIASQVDLKYLTPE
jgi:hypothetical protein